MILRTLTGLALVLGLFFLPWAVVFGAVILAAAFYPWYLEGLVVGFVSAGIADADAWKFFVIFASVVLGQEWLKSRISGGNIFSTAWAAVFGGLIFLLSSFIFI